MIQNISKLDAVAIVGLLLVVALFGYGAMADDTNPEYDKVCQDEFGGEYSYNGYISGNPPTVVCTGPGHTGYMDMPEWMAEEHGMTAEAYNDSK